MCITPSKIWIEQGPTWVEQPVPCKHCWQCRSNRVSDYEGRALCEAATSDHTITVTLTYAPRDDGADKILTISHFQDYIRSLRKRGHSVRYLVAGEYGERKGRAHFHAILFFKGCKPQYPQQKNHHCPSWPHGFLFADHNIDSRSIRYVCKYIHKDMDTDERKQAWFSLSKKPALGHDWMVEKAKQDAQAGVFPRTFGYVAPGGHRSREYMMNNTTRREYLAALMKEYAILGRKAKFSELSEFCAKEYKKLRDAAHVKAWWNLPPSTLWEIFCQEIERKRPTSRAVLKVFFDTEPQSGVELDWAKIHKEWKHGKPQETKTIEPHRNRSAKFAKRLEHCERTIQAGEGVSIARDAHTGAGRKGNPDPYKERFRARQSAGGSSGGKSSLCGSSREPATGRGKAARKPCSAA